MDNFQNAKVFSPKKKLQNWEYSRNLDRIQGMLIYVQDIQLIFRIY